MGTEVHFSETTLGSLGESFGQLQQLEQVTGSDVNAAAEVSANIPKNAKEAEAAASQLAAAGAAFALGNFVPGLGTAAGAIVALGIIIGPKVFEGIKNAFKKKKNPWVKRIRKVENANVPAAEKWQAMWALQKTAQLNVKQFSALRGAARSAFSDDLRWARGAVIATQDRMNKIFPTIPLAQRQKIEPLVVTVPQTAQFLRGFPVKLSDIQNLTDDQIKLWIGGFDSRLSILNGLIAKGVTSAVFTRDQLQRYKDVYQGVLFARQKTRADIAERARKDAEAKRALDNFIRFLTQLEKQINDIDVRDFKKPKQIEDTLAIAGAARQQAVAINATGVIAAIDNKTAELQKRLKQIKTQRAVGGAATVAAIGTALVRFL